MTKYNARAVMVDNIRFASQKEARRYGELKLLERAGEIRNLELQPRFNISINGKHCFFYRADFAFFEGEKRVVLDVKGVRTPVYKIKKRCVEAAYNIKIVEV